MSKVSLSSVVLVSALAISVACGKGSDRGGFDDSSPATDPAPSGDLGGEAGAGKTPPGTPCEVAAAAKGYAGCDFRVAPSPVKGAITDLAPCYAVFVTNVAKQPTTIKVSLGTSVFDATKFGRIPNGDVDPSKWAPLGASGLAPGDMAVLFLSHNPQAQSTNFDNLFCPVKPAVEDATGQPLILPGRATTFHIETEQPVVAYDMMPFGGARSFAPSAQILLPTSAWGKNYVGVVPPMDLLTTASTPGQDSWMMIAATENGTTVEVATRGVLLDGQGPDAVPANAKKKLPLDAGEYILWITPRTDGKDASGTVFTSDKPVSLTVGDIWTGIASTTSQRQQPMGNGQMLGPVTYCCMDASHQMLSPVGSVGNDYVAAPFPTRLASNQDESIKYRILGMVDGTSLTYDPPVPGAPGVIAFGAAIDFESRGAFRIKSQDTKHPFYLAQTMSYASMEGPTKQDGTDGVFKVATTLPVSLGDPEFVNVLPAGQYLTEYTFLTDPTYATTSLVVVRAKDPAKGFSDVDLACLGKITGFQPVGTGGDYEWTRLDLQRKYVPNGKCNVSTHKATSEGRFAIQVWGVDWWASYAYPAGGSVAQLNDVVVAPH